jgi:hypothetical protein
VRDLVDDAALKRARRMFPPGTLFVAPMAEEASGRNAIPAMFAAWLAAGTDGHVAQDAIQTNRAHHTGARPMERMIARPLFAGPVLKDSRYVVVDDVSTMGGTLAEIADHIREGGGENRGYGAVGKRQPRDYNGASCDPDRGSEKEVRRCHRTNLPHSTRSPHSCRSPIPHRLPRC